jgi:hypothetical protein
MTQRAIQEDVVKLALEYGESLADGRVVLTRKHAEAVGQIGDRLKSLSQRVLKKNGVVVVMNGELEITTYPMSNY